MSTGRTRAKPEPARRTPASRELPFRAQLEHAFGRPLGHVDARVGAAAELAELDALALASRNLVMFAQAAPSPALVAHEIAHVLQRERAAAVARGVAPSDGPAEREAEGIGAEVEAHGLDRRLPAVVALAEAEIHLVRGTPSLRPAVERFEEARALLAAIQQDQTSEILAILTANAAPEHMYALRYGWDTQVIGDPMWRAIQRTIEGDAWVRARVYLGAQVPLHFQFEGRDTTAVHRFLHRLTDQDALALVAGAPDTETRIALPETMAADATGPTVLPEYTTFALVKQALAKQPDADAYYQAIRILLEKAARAQAWHAAHAPELPAGWEEISISGLVPLEPTADGEGFTIARWAELGAVSVARVDLAEQRIRAAAANVVWTASPREHGAAYLALADLDATERLALVARFEQEPLGQDAEAVASLVELARKTDDATVIKEAIERAHVFDTSAALEGAGVAVAIERGGALIAAARERLQKLAPDASEADRAAAQAEVARLSALFFGDDSKVRDALASPDRGPAYIERLKAMGADPVLIALEQIQQLPQNDFKALIKVLRQVPAEQRPKVLGESLWLPTWRFTADQQELLDAYRGIGDPIQVDPAMMEAHLDLGLDLSLVTSDEAAVGGLMLLQPRTSATTIALFDVLDAIERGPGAAGEALYALQHLSDAERKDLYSDARYRTAVEALPYRSGDEHFAERDFKDRLGIAEHSGPDVALLNYPGNYRGVELEKFRTEAERTGRLNLRRAYVQQQRKAADPTYAETLTQGELDTIEQLEKLQATNNKYIIEAAGDRELVEDIIYGEPQLVDTDDSLVEPETEADFMRFRLRAAAGVSAGESLAEWTGSSGPNEAAIEALVTFEALYDRFRPGGIDRGELAQLVEVFYQATADLKTYKLKLEENRQSALRWAQIVGAVVAGVVIMVASAGTASGLVIAGWATLLGGTGSMLAGYAVRWDNTPWTALRDFGTGAVEGLASVAGAGLAAKVVRAGTAGMGAARAASTAGANAVGQATKSSAGQMIVQNMIEGAFGGAAGELFQTATDEATWDRGIAHAFATMLAAAARGGLMGAAGGGVLTGAALGLGKLAAKFGDETAREVSAMLDAAAIDAKVIDTLPEDVQLQLVKLNELRAAGKLDEGIDAIRGMTKLSKNVRELLIDEIRRRQTAAMMQTGMLHAGDPHWITFVDDADFKKVGATQRGDAVIVIQDGAPHMFVRRGARPSVLREEITHLEQWYGDPTMRVRMEMLTEENLRDFAKLPAAKQVDLHIAKLEVEADAQQRIIAKLEQEPDLEDVGLRIDDASENLFEITQRLDKLRRVRRGVLPPSEVSFGELPLLFTKSAATPRKLPRGARKQALALADGRKTAEANVGALEKLGYVVHRNQNGAVFRITRKPEHYDKLPHLTLGDDGKIIPGKGIQSFTERQAAADAMWDANTFRLQQLASAKQLKKADRTFLATAGTKLRSHLGKQIAAGTIDKGSAGLISKWGNVMQDLERRAANMSPAFRTNTFLTSFIGKHKPDVPWSEAMVDNFRRELRDELADYLMRIDDPASRYRALHALIDLQPDPASMGHLFTAFRRKAMANMKVGFVVPDELVKPRAFLGQRGSQSRQADELLTLTGSYGKLPKGRIGIEDKTGKGAFKLDQAEDYAARATQDGFAHRTPPRGSPKDAPRGVEFENLVYMFSSKAEAEAAVKAMRAHKNINRLLGRDPGIHVMFLHDRTARLEVVDLGLTTDQLGRR